MLFFSQAWGTREERETPKGTRLVWERVWVPSRITTRLGGSGPSSMAQRGKRKTRSNVSSPRAPQGKRRINLNGASSSQAKTEQDLPSSPPPPAPIQLEHTEPSSSTNSAKSASKSTFSLPFFPLRSSSSPPSVNGAAASPSLLSRIRGYLPERPRKKMKVEEDRRKVNGSKGKQRAEADLDELGNINAEESARMIDLLDAPVSVQPWHLRGNSANDHEESISDYSVEDLLQSKIEGDEEGSAGKTMQRNATPPPLSEVQVSSPASQDGAEGAVEAAQKLENVVLASPTEAAEKEEEAAGEEAGQVILGEVPQEAEADKVVVISNGEGTEEPMEEAVSQWMAGLPVAEQPSSAEQKELAAEEAPPKNVIADDQSISITHTAELEGDVSDGHQTVEVFARASDRADARENGGEAATELSQVEEGLDDDAAVVRPLEADISEDNVSDGSKNGGDKESSPHVFQAQTGASTGETVEALVDEGTDGEEEDEIVLLPTAGKTAHTVEETNGVIDLTDSPEPEQSEAPALAPSPAAIVPTPQRKANGFFSNGTLAREKLSPSFALNHSSASHVIQQLGQRQMSVASSSQSKSIAKPSLGFRKKDPIFNKARKSLAKGIASSKVDDLLASLKRHVKQTLKTPFLDEMLKKRVAIAKVLADEAPEDEVQIRHLRDILKRSESKYRSSLRPARRLLKEQERLALEARLLQRRALGILGRSPLPPTLTDEQEDVVRQTLQKQGKIAQVPGAGVEARDITKLRPGQWLNDEVINFYTKLILSRSDEAAKKRGLAREAKKRLAANAYVNDSERAADVLAARDAKRVWNGIWNVWLFTSFFYEKLSTAGYAGVRQWTRKVDIFAKDLVLLPINMGQMHWVCAAINMRQCRIEYYDSMHSPNPRVFDVLQRYLLDEYADKKKTGPSLDLSGWRRYFSRQSPAQANGFDCGVFATMTLEQISRRNPAEGDLPDDGSSEAVVRRSATLAEQRAQEDSSGDSSDDDDGDDDDEDEEWNFTQSDMPYLRRRMVYEIASARLLDE